MPLRRAHTWPFGGLVPLRARFGTLSPLRGRPAGPRTPQLEPQHWSNGGRPRARPVRASLGHPRACATSRPDSSKASSPVYQVQDSGALLKGSRRLLSRGRPATRVSRTVLLLGVVSLLTDISSEMVSTVLPLYLVYTLGLHARSSTAWWTASTRARRARARLVGGFAGDRLKPPQGGGLGRLWPLGGLQDRPAGRRQRVRSAIGALVLSTGRARASAPRRATR